MQIDTATSTPALQLHSENAPALFTSLVSVLVGFGVLMVHSASITSWPTEFERVYLSRHLLFVAVGVVVAFICSRMPARFWFRVAPSLFCVTIGLLALLLVPGIGSRVNGAQRWLRFGGFSFQPSELAKVALPLMLGRLLIQRREQLNRLFSGTLPFAIPTAIVIGLVLLQPDLGTALFLTIACAITLFLGGWPIRNFLAPLFIGVPGLVWFVMQNPYQLKRITGFVDAWTNFDSAPYQLQQSLMALGAGGTSGVGLGKGWQKLSFLPEANTDFVLAVVGEELGLIATLSLIVLWVCTYAAGLRLLRHLPRDSFAYLVGGTLLTLIVLQAAVNTAVVTAMVPPKGIPHPFMSYGGSSLVVTLMAIGIVISLSRDECEPDEVPATVVDSRED